MKRKHERSGLFNAIKALIEEAKSRIVRNLNSIIVYTHFEIGKTIAQNEQKGKSRLRRKNVSSIKRRFDRRVWKWLFPFQSGIYEKVLPVVSDQNIPATG